MSREFMLSARLDDDDDDDDGGGGGYELHYFFFRINSFSNLKIQPEFGKSYQEKRFSSKLLVLFFYNNLWIWITLLLNLFSA